VRNVSTGSATVQVVHALREELGVPITGVVDRSTVEVINKKLGNGNAEERVVRGSVRLATGAPANGVPDGCQGVAPGPRLVHRSRQKIQPSLAALGKLPRFRRGQGAERVNLLNASVH
jgi:hypothetical protein